MKTHLIILALLISSYSAFAISNEQATHILKKMLAAQKAHNYDEFVDDADDNLKAALTQIQFDAASNLLNEKFAEGYDLTYLGVLNQKGFQVFLYRLRAKDGSDDTLATLSMKDGKVGGIFFH